MTYAREQINGTTGQDLNKMNENFMSLWSKVFGDISFSDANAKLQETILTQYIPFQGEGNADNKFPYTIRFYIPPNVKKIKNSTMSAVLEAYRMDSATTESGGKVENLDISIGMSEAGGGSFVTNGTQATGHGGGNFSGSTTSYVSSWGDPNCGVLTSAPTKIIAPNASYDGSFYLTDGAGGKGINVTAVSTDGTARQIVDLARIQHNHVVNISGYVSVSVNVPGQTGSFVMPPHSHNAVGKVSFPAHQHANEPGIKLATNIGNMGLYVNGNNLYTLSTSNRVKNDIDIKDYLKIGEWNTIECKTSSLGRITVYGTVECVMKSV